MQLWYKVHGCPEPEAPAEDVTLATGGPEAMALHHDVSSQACMHSNGVCADGKRM